MCTHKIIFIPLFQPSVVDVHLKEEEEGEEEEEERGDVGDGSETETKWTPEPEDQSEFVIYQGQDYHYTYGYSLIRTIVIVKNNVPLISTVDSVDEAHTQLFSELIASYKHNLAIDSGYNGTVYGALTDAYNWVFARVHRSVVDEQESYHIQWTNRGSHIMDGPWREFSRSAAPYSFECLQHIIYILHSDLLTRQGWSDPVTGEQVQDILRQCNVVVKDKADKYVEDVFWYARIESEKTKALKAENAVLQAEIVAYRERAEDYREMNAVAEAERARLKAAIEEANKGK